MEHLSPAWGRKFRRRRRRRRRCRPWKNVDDKNPQDGNPLFQKCPSDFFIYENALKLFK